MPAPTDPAIHGTPSRYDMHLRDGEPACDDCKKAHTQAEFARRIRPPSKAGFVIPVILAAELYVNAPIPLQEKVERVLGIPACDALVERLDNQ